MNLGWHIGPKDLKMAYIQFDFGICLNIDFIFVTLHFCVLYIILWINSIKCESVFQRNPNYTYCLTKSNSIVTCFSKNPIRMDSSPN